MAGTLADQAALANTNAFIDNVRVAILSRSKKILDNTAGRETEAGKLQRQLAIIHSAISSGLGGLERQVAWLVATMDNSISSGSPALPADNDLQNAVNTQLARLWE